VDAADTAAIEVNTHERQRVVVLHMYRDDIEVTEWRFQERRGVTRSSSVQQEVAPESAVLRAV
jgi:hypothetical protein